MIALKMIKIQVMMHTIILPDSYNREYMGIFNDSTGDTKDMGNILLINIT